MYTWGSSGSTNDKFHPNDIIRFEADMKAKTVRFFINKKEQGSSGKPLWSNINKGPIYPAISFYGSDRSCELIKVEKKCNRTGDYCGHLAYASNKLFAYDLKGFSSFYDNDSKAWLF